MSIGPHRLQGFMAWRAVLLVAVVLLQYVSSCVGMQSNCAVVSAVGQYRKDYSLPYSLYPTYNKVDPTAGTTHQAYVCIL